LLQIRCRRFTTTQTTVSETDRVFYRLNKQVTPVNPNHLLLYALGLAAVLTLAFATWVLSVAKRNVAIVDSVWSLMFILEAGIYVFGSPAPSARGLLVVVLVSIWGLRLALHITVRSWGHGEDRRYQAIRARNEPGFAFKSLYLVFVLQAVMAWIIALPLLGAAIGSRPLGLLDAVGAALWLLGFVFEAGGDWQLNRFKANPSNRGKVMDRGLWRWTRHPNYFGDFCVWWGFYAIALSAGAWWSVVGPLLMSVLLMRVSGVTLLEKDIGERRPKYADYIRRTNAFFPGRPKR
jgi:steroid 5-alpha reductase family enzyme